MYRVSGGFMRTLLLVFGLLGATSVSAVELTYSCSGLWAGPHAILDSKAVVKGSFDPHGSVIAIDLNLETGGHLTGAFQGRDGKFSQGAFSFDGDVAPKIYGSLTRITSVGGANDGFRFDSAGTSAVWRCTR